MNTRALFLFVSIVFPSLFASAANVTWTGTAGDWLWSTAENWDAGTVPTASDDVTVNEGTEASPVRIVSGDVPEALTLSVGSVAESVGFISIQDALLTLPAGKNAVIGDSGAGTVVITGDNGGLQTCVSGQSGKLYLGKAATGTGVVVLHSGVLGFGYNGYIGDAGVGTLDLRGGTVTCDRPLYLGNQSTGKGTFLMSGGLLDIGRGELVVGQSGTGYALLSGGNCRPRGISLGLNAGSIGTVEVLEGGVYESLSNYAANIGVSGAGIFHLRGGISKNFNTQNPLRIRTSSSGYGLLLGWGTWNIGTKCSVDNSGLVIADGEGEERRLVINAAGTTCSSANSIDNDSTNGWYAVNKGQLYVNMRADVAVGETGVFTWGDANADEVIDMVNSARITFHSVSGKNGILSVGGTISAFDRTDAHFESLPAAATKVGNWTFSLTNGGGCSAYDLTLRYDHVAAKGLTLTLRRWNGSAWDAVDGVTWDSANYLAKATGLTPDSSTALGTFAIVGAAPSTCVLIR